MRLSTRVNRSGLRQRRSQLLGLVLVLGMLATAVGLQVWAATPQSAHLQVPAITLQVNSVGVSPYSVGGTITEFAYLVNEDNSGDPTDPDSSVHPSLKPMASHSPIVASGTVSGTNQVTLNLPDGRYLVTVRADGHKLSGKHFRLPDDAGATVNVDLLAEPLPLSRIRVHVFRDNFPVNGENDIPREAGLEGFRIILDDTAGEVTVDWYGNPLCTEYDGNPAGSTPLGDPIPGSGGICFTDANGDAVIENLPRGKYEVKAVAPDGQESEWIQTTTIEGTHVIDAWIEEGNTGYSPREGFQTAGVWIGFVQECEFGDTTDSCSTNDTPGSGTIMGTVRTTIEWTPPVNPLTLGEPMYKPWIALTDIGNNDVQVYLGRGNPDGSFVINDVPDGIYQMAVWDDPLDYVIGFRTVEVTGGGTVDMGEFGIPRWFGWISGHVFLDEDGDGIQDPGEIGIPGMDLATRFRDGTIQYGTLTDNDGFYEFSEVKELEKFAVAEVGFGRMARTGASVHDEYDPSLIKSTHDGALTLSELTWAAKRSIIDWGKRPYDVAAGENGGISGIVFYAVTRNEESVRFAAAEDYEPGIPHVTLRLYDETGEVLLNEVQTDAYEHPTDCDVLDANGDPLDDPIGLGPNCIEVPNISNEVKDGVFDGGYAFESYWDPYFGAPGAVEVDGLPPGNYVVEVLAPDHYKVLTEADINTEDGNDLVPSIPAAPCVDTGECGQRVVRLQPGQNAAADFFLLTENAVPIPGRIFGFLLDDVNVETDPNRIYYGEKRGIPNAPVGIRDFTGWLITTVQSDENGIFEVLLPSTYVANCPTPSGVCPAMYQVVSNDPGDRDNPNPNFNPNYQTLTFVFDVWPGKTTYADVATFPITAFAAFPGSQYGQPAQCTLADDTPQIYAVDPPYGNPGDTITIQGAGFGTTEGQIALAGVTIPPAAVNWISDTEIQFLLPLAGPAGAHQLLVTAANGETSHTGLTFHKLGTGYSPTIVRVPTDAVTIQDAIDGASGNTLVVIEPGVYYDPINLNKAGVRLQGYGPGEPVQGSGGSVIDQRFIITEVGFNVVGDPLNPFGSSFNPQIDGLRITAARDEQDIGGGIHVDAHAQFLEISNNVIQSNGGNFGGGITLGEPYRGDNNNDDISIHHNRVLNNGGISLAGGIGIFNGADDYEIGYNDICGNYSAEYGGGISHFGRSPGGVIHHNRLYHNNAFDEGGAILVGGEQFFNPEDPGENPTLTQGAGAVEIYANLIHSNLSNDDGGGVRLLQPWDDAIDIVNNMIVNNVATDFGGGIALDDASDVTIVNNTIAKNKTTSTAEDSDGLAHGVGLAAEGYSTAFTDYLVNTYGSAAPGFPDPLMFNNIFWDNQAYTWDGTQLVFDSVIDMEVFGLPATFTGHPSNLIGVDPSFVDPYDTELDAVAFRQEPNFITVIMVTVGVSETLPGDYHLLPGSAAIDAGAASASGVSAPCDDFDRDGRPNGGLYDVGADEQSGLAPTTQCLLTTP